MKFLFWKARFGDPGILHNMLNRLNKAIKFTMESSRTELKQRMPIREYYPGEKPYRMVYVEDPFGLIFEVYSHSYELTYSQGAY